MKIAQLNKQEFHYSPLRYPGGKTRLYPVFERMIKENELEDVTYVEPFAGGAGAALALLINGVVERIVINDLDRAIYAFWKSVTFESERFIDELSRVPVTVQEWKKQKAVYSNKKSRLFELGFATFFLNRTNVSGVLNGGPIGGLKQEGDWSIDARFYRDTLKSRIQRLSEFSERIQITNLDVFPVVRKFLSDRKSFIYLDPPYVDKGASLYLNHFDSSDHRRLATSLNNKLDTNWVLTYDSVSPIKKLYPKRKCVNFSLNYHAHGFRKGKELLILSDALKI